MIEFIIEEGVEYLVVQLYHVCDDSKDCCTQGLDSTQWFLRIPNYNLSMGYYLCLDNVHYWNHRIHGPAVIYDNGREVWCLNGKRFDSKEAFDKMLARYMKLKAFW